jgi:sec-independent protein translocase protein TatB
MLNIGITEMMLIAVLAIVFVGPDRLPEMMRFMGRQYGKLRRASNELRRAFQLEVDRVDAEARAKEIQARRKALEERRRAAAAAARRESSAGPQPMPRPLPEPVAPAPSPEDEGEEAAKEVAE